MPRLSLNKICSLVEQAQKGDKEAFAELYRATVHAQYSTAIGMLKQPALAEDAIQTIYMQVYRNLPGLSGPERFLSWLPKITYNTCLNILKSRKREPAGLDDELLETLPDFKQDINPLHTMINQENRDFMNTLLEELSIDHRTILLMRYYQDLKVKEIAEIMHLSEGTVKSRIHYALRKMKASLKKRGIRGTEGVLSGGILLRRAFKGPDISADKTGEGIRERFSDCLKIAAGCAAAGFIMAGASKSLPLPEIKDVRVVEASGYTNESVRINISAMVKDSADIQVSYENGEELPVIHKKGYEFYTMAKRNGKIIVRVNSDTGMAREKAVTVNNIDLDKPKPQRYEMAGRNLRAYLADELSGIDYGDIQVLADGLPVELTEVNIQQSYVEFPYSGNKSYVIKLKDHAGNRSSDNIEVTEQITS